jgi:hypothetical protein
VAEKAGEIMNHINIEREQLGRDFDEIEGRVKQATDIRGCFNRNKGIVLGSAVAGGILLTLALRKRRTSPIVEDADNIAEAAAMEGNGQLYSRQSKASPAPRMVSKHMGRVTDTVDAIIDAFIGVACGKVVEFIADSVPSFQEEYDAHRRDRSWRSVHSTEPEL